MWPRDADRRANSVYPDQTAPRLVMIYSRLLGEENQSHIEVQVLIYSRHPLCASTPVQPGEEDLSHIEVTHSRGTAYDIASIDLFQAPSMLPLLLYSLGKKTWPTLKLHILEALPMILQVLIYSSRPLCCLYSCTAWGR